MKRLIFGAFLILALAGGAAGYLLLTDKGKPEIALVPDSEMASPKREFTLTLGDVGSGLKSAKVVVSQDAKQITLLDKTFATPVRDAVETFTLEPAGLHDGPFTLAVTATDRSIANFGAGNTASLTRQITLDTTPPRVDVLSMAHIVRQGGVGAVSFSVNENTESAGVVVGDEFYPASKLDNGKYFGLYVFPYNMDPKNFVPKVKVTDKAGNVGMASFRYQAIPRKFRDDKLNISDAFLDSKMPQYYNIITDTRDNLQIYLRVNNDIRRQNSVFLKELAQKSAPTMLWDKKAFLRLPNAAPRAGFGDHRTYYYQNREIDQQTHMGVDLASLEGAPVPAANTGKVVFAGFLGIYGETVIIDHGLGLQTLYSHLRQIDVKVGQDIKKGEILGKTGVSGLAAGDHLHFGVLVFGQETSPIEWWDQHWIDDNILSKL
ncbi:peptidoglycan DD-metalloendopeptidase family protein [Desulfovibrio aerotolerans]|uniref:Peptidoglycan DD-metalloendopeptidase family protein n=1 Tax=Solidesulfovibrio aerotolerans TaxID=295255 RepID=A0A7C9MDM7_9BACT|nr:peptidoglycan DD-metalloendopeptidase family protein [Solidesulfovibrio aerotolerans]MYL81970.1 peptidoglycan DD-metalloendopeptidase family protein [Solidesulfovibrio aerotolerans]